MATTETLTALMVGLGLGFVGSMPIAGPIAVLVLHRGLSRRLGDGMRIAAGAAIAETVHAFLAFWGVGALLRSFPSVLPIARLVGAAVLVAVGVYLIRRRSPPPETGTDSRPQSRRRGFLLGLTLTLLNPTLIATWTMTVTAIHSSGLLPTDPASAAPFALGVGAGILLWFTVLLQALARFQRTLQPATVNRIIRLIGWLVVALGVGLAARQALASLGIIGG